MASSVAQPTLYLKNCANQFRHVVILPVELEDIAVESAKKRLLWKTLRSGYKVHVKERVTIVLGNPPVQPLVKMFQMIAESAKGTEVNTRQVNVTRQDRGTLRRGLRFQDLVD